MRRRGVVLGVAVGYAVLGARIESTWANAWDRSVPGDGSPATASHALTVGPKSLAVVQATSTVPSLSGSITVAYDGRYGDLAGKAVGLEPATGFAFDTPLEPRPKMRTRTRSS
jgi:hypothetical protein